MITPIHKAKVEKCKLVMFNAEYWHKNLQALEGKHVDVTVKLPSKNSSNKQRKWLFGIAYRLISDHTGMTVEEIHDCQPLTALRMDYTKKYPTPKSVAMLSMDTRDFSDYMTKVQQWASSELSIVIPDPDKAEGTI